MTAWLADALIGSALLMGAVLLLRSPVRRLFGPRIAYALWALPALRLALPPLPSWAVEAAPVTMSRETIVVLIAAPEAAPAFPVATLFTAIWAAGAAALLAWHLVRHYRFTRAILAGAEHVADTDGIRIVVSNAAAGPLAFGLWRRIVALPRDWYVRYDREEREMALAHEIAHHNRGDLIAGAAALVVLACHWFDPLAWAAARAFRIDQELATDAHVLARTDRKLRAPYAAAIVKAARGPGPHTNSLGPAPRTVACLHTVSDLKGRLKMLALAPASRRRLGTGSAAVCALAAAGLAATASGTPAAAALADGVGNAVAQVAPLAPPAPPVPPASAAGAKVHRIVINRNGDTRIYEGADADAYLAANPIPAPAAKQRKRVVVVRDGKTQTFEGAAADAYLADNPLPVPPVPPVSPAPPEPEAAPAPHPSRIIVRTHEGDIRSRDFGGVAWSDVPRVGSLDCPGGDDRRMVLNDARDGERRVIVCTNRIAAVVRQAAVTAANAGEMRRNALRQALDGLRASRASMTATRDMAEWERGHVRETIDRSIRNLERQLARES